MNWLKILKKNKKYWLKFAGIFLGIFILLFIAANYDYFWQNINYYLRPRPTTPPAAQTQPATKLPQGPANMISIPSLNISAPVVYATGTTEQIFQADLINGVVHYPGTANPGETGNCYIFGHSSDYIWSKGHYKTVFALLPHIKLGDIVVVSDWHGNQFSYVVKQTEIAAPTDLQYLQQDYGKRVLTVQTSYPVGTALKRFLAIAELQNP